MKEWFAAAELVGIAGLPGTVQNVTALAKRAEWLSRPRQGRGGGREYHVSCLPARAREALVERFAKSTPTDAAPAIVATNMFPQPAHEEVSPTSSALAGWQRRRMEARLALLAEVDRLSPTGGRELAIAKMVQLAARSELPERLQRLVSLANARCGEEGKRTLSRPTLYRWLAERTKGAGALAPREPKAREIPPWAPPLLGLYQRPQKPTLRAVMEQLPEALPSGVAMPSYHQAQRFLARLSTIELHRGRLGPRALKALKPYVKRDVADLDPLDVVEMDGHTADFEVAHPAHGGPFRPEITTVIDVTTRVALGWSAGLAESAHAVMDALRHAVERRGIPAILYVDRGSGYRADVTSGEVTGLLARLGIRHEESLPYNSQARGRIERAHQTIWVRGGRALPTFVGAEMDKEAATNVHKLTRRDLAGKGARLLMPWTEFLAWAQAQVDAYNNRPHRGLPKIADPGTGKARHMTPEEAWRVAIEAGFGPMRVTEAEAIDLFRPHREVTTRRGLVQLFGNSYFHQDLAHHGGGRVHVAYDMHDPKRVWVKTLDGRLICVAEWEANKRAFFPRSVVEQAREDRARGRARRLEIQLEEVRAEARGPALEHQPAEPLTVEQLAAAEAQLARLTAPMPANEPASDERPFFRSDADYVAWMRANPDRTTPDDDAWLQDRKKSWAFRVLHGFEEANAATG